MSIIHLAPVFTLETARQAGLRKDEVYSLLAQGQLERVGRGVYAQPDAIDVMYLPLAVATVVHEQATLCLTSALVYHDLSDAIPADSNIALPRGIRHPAGIAHVSWHSFDPATFHIGREFLEIDDEITVAIYSPERTIVDCFRLIHLESSDVAYEALKRWLKTKGNTPSGLLKVAAAFPSSLSKIRQVLEVML